MDTGSRQLQNCFFDRLDDFTEILRAFEYLPDSLFMIKDRSSTYVFMSRCLREAIGLPGGMEVVGKTDFNLFPKIVAESYRQNDRLVLDEGRTLVNEIHAGGFSTGTPKWFFSSKFPLRDRDGAICGLFTTNQRYEEVMGGDDDLNRLLPAIDHMTKAYADKITNAELARMCGFSESHFMRLFKERMSLTPRAFLEQVRMFHAIEAIKHRATSIAGIAIDCGFYDHSSFVKRFKAFTGVTPLLYRRNFQAGHRGETAMALPTVR
jgi:AraC-like DNA-binding protein